MRNVLIEDPVHPAWRWNNIFPKGSLRRHYRITRQRETTVTHPAGFVDALNEESNFPVLARTDKGILAVPECAGESLLKLRNKDRLSDVLTFHLVPGKIMSTDIVGQSTEVKSARGSVLSVDAIDSVRVDSASVVHADIGRITE